MFSTASRPLTRGSGLIALLAVAAFAAVAQASSVHWDFDVTTYGEDVFWTSPTNVDPAAWAYDGTYTITGVWVHTPLMGWVDVISLIPPEELSNTLVQRG